MVHKFIDISTALLILGRKPKYYWNNQAAQKDEIQGLYFYGILKRGNKTNQKKILQQIISYLLTVFIVYVFPKYCTNFYD